MEWMGVQFANGKVWPLRRQPDPVHDWFEDFDHENGMYDCKCCNCGVIFIGHKRRVVCFECASQALEKRRAKTER